jgi:hypothetical protein
MLGRAVTKQSSINVRGPCEVNGGADDGFCDEDCWDDGFNGNFDSGCNAKRTKRKTGT